MGETLARRCTALLLAASISLTTLSGCPKGSDALVPRSRRGWSVVFIVVGATWIIVGGAAATNPGTEEEPRSASDRAVTALGATALGLALIAAGWALWPSKPAKPVPPTPPPTPPPSGPPGQPTSPPYPPSQIPSAGSALH